MPWHAPEQWASMVRGDACPMCADAHLPHNEHSVLLATTGWSHIRLHRNQSQPGYVLIVAKRHVAELHHLTAKERDGFYADVAAISGVVADLFQPVKLATLSMGFRLPHHHCHVYPQYQHDDPYRLIDVTSGSHTMSPEALARRAAKMRDRLSAALAQREP